MSPTAELLFHTVVPTPSSPHRRLQTLHAVFSMPSSPPRRRLHSPSLNIVGRIGSRTDIGWQHGVDVENNSKKHHLAGTHRDVEPCLTVPDDVKNKMQSIVDKLAKVADKRKRKSYGIDDSDDEDPLPKATDKGKMKMDTFSRSKKGSNFGSTQATINQMMKKELRDEACQEIARFIYGCAIPFNCVKHPSFQKMFELVGRYGCGFKAPTYHEVRETLLKKEVNQTKELLEVYKAEWKKIGCSVMSDGWTDKKRRSICNFLVNSPRGTVFLKSIDTSNVSKTTKKVFEMLDEIIDEVGGENVVQVITDNAANYKAAGEMLMEKRKNLYWTPCVAHCIDLILEDFEKKLEVHKETITKARRVATYIYSRTLLISMLRHFTKSRDLIRPATTRFATAYLTLSCFKELKVFLMTMFSSQSWKTSRFAKTNEGKCVEQTISDSKFWHNVVVCLKAAIPLIKVLRLVDSEEKPAMGFIYNAMDSAKEQIQANFNNVKRKFQSILNIIDERWELQLHRSLHAAAYFLNPQYQYSPDFKVSMELKLNLYQCLDRLVTSQCDRDKIDIQIEDFKSTKGLFGINAAIVARDKKTPAAWWDSYGDGCPELQKFAIRVLSLTCSSSGCERNWSAFEMVHTKKRNRLQQKKMNDLVFVMSNMKMINRKSKKEELFTIDDLSSDDEWITEENDHIDRDDLDQINEVDGHDVEPIHLVDEEGSGNVAGANDISSIVHHANDGSDGDNDSDESDDLHLSMDDLY
ncbi:uncharacterized protein LOC121999379 [Zingiber officinale]|uniref:uncharacterized protein LOC121999379 n=1 Tax=Zingiber officinale TaxID=94328 RepID=UPI001C4BAB8F|nr:uncharacterized protein LOC121999379 [Zingiber officinale]